MFDNTLCHIICPTICSRCATYRDLGNNSSFVGEVLICIEYRLLVINQCFFSVGSTVGGAAVVLGTTSIQV